MKINVKNRLKLKRKWHIWFAWYPVQIIKNNMITWAWFTKVERIMRDGVGFDYFRFYYCKPLGSKGEGIINLDLIWKAIFPTLLVLIMIVFVLLLVC